MEPHRDGLPTTDEEGMVLKNPPTGSSPSRLLNETLNVTSLERFVSSFGRLSDKLLNDKSRISRSDRLAIEIGTGPVRLLRDKTLYKKQKQQRQFQIKEQT